MPPTSKHPDLSAHLSALCIEMRDLLGKAKKSVEDEIRAYPTPIPRCDAQFNHLYEQRSRLSRMLARANAVSTRGDGMSELAGTLAEFTASARFTEEADEQVLRERIAAAMAAARPS